MKTKLILALICLVLISACQQDDPTPTATDLPTPPAETSTTLPIATETTTPTLRPLPIDSVTPLPPPPTAQIQATSTLAPTPTPSPTPTPVQLLSADDFGMDRSPFTGRIVEDTDNLLRRPLAVKISNWPAAQVRPQSGLSQADIVFEHMAEGATRFTAIFHSQTPPDLGSIRSARLIDLELPVMYDAALVYSGASDGVNAQLAQSSFRSRQLRSAGDGYYRTGEDKPYEHTFFAHPDQLWESLEEREQNTPPDISNFMPFDETPPEDGEPASALEVRYRNTTVNWTYDPEAGLYMREADGEPHMDANTDEQLASANVVVLFVYHDLNRDICENVVNGVCTAYSLEIRLWDEGEALFFRDGQVYEARWVRPGTNALLTLQTEDGDPLPFQIGNTWFQVLSLLDEESVTITP